MDIYSYFSKDKKGTALTKEFYNLSLSDKYHVIKELENDGTLLQDSVRYDRLISAVLQHSSDEMKKEYPCQWERQQRPEAKAADKRDIMKQAYQALFVNWLKIEKILIKIGILQGITE